MTRLVVIILILFVSKQTFSANEKWQVPDENAKKTNPLVLNPRNVNVGKNIFIRSCVACHGTKADGRGLIYSTNLLSDTFQNQSDGNIFYKISTGRNKMPPFAGMLKEEEIWSVVNYLRVLVNPTLVPPAKNVKVDVSLNQELKSITAFVYSADTLKTPLSEVDVHFYIQRDFGIRQFGEQSNFTKTNGRVTVSFPDNIIGDTLGNVKIYIKVENNFMYNDTTITITEKWGKPLETHPELSKIRSLWSARDKSPIWLLFLANGIIVAVWGAIVYVIINVIRIKKAGRIFIK